jgi:bifunctional DNA-binding transcriptional regulator/antitoxin component of YhaV-PrlF toxin-antitoxin module
MPSEDTPFYSDDLEFMGTASASRTFAVTVPASVRRRLGWNEPGEVFFFVSPNHGSAVMLVGPPAPELLRFLSDHRPRQAGPSSKPHGRP